MQTTPNHKAAQILQTELTIARLLRWGVMLSFAIVAIGIGGVLITGQTGYHAVRLNDLNSLVQYNAAPDFPNSPGEVFHGLLALKPYAIIALGLLVLISIPVLRVAVSVVAFARERDWLYVAITGFVLVVLAVSFVLGQAGG